MSVTNNESDQEMLQVHVTESLPTIRWLVSKGHDWVPANQVEKLQDVSQLPGLLAKS